jgi:MraZ protein
MFIGEYKHNLDVKGRLAIPVKFRAKLGEGAVVTRGLDNCLFLYTREQWEKEAERLVSLPMKKSKARKHARLVLAGAMEVECDTQGRVNLPEYLRKYASLDKKAVIAGLVDHLEIWDEAKWEAYKLEAEKESSEIAESLGDLGI